nr:hypothetical protein [Tanacetum cinerariifolium]
MASKLGGIYSILGRLPENAKIKEFETLKDNIQALNFARKIEDCQLGLLEVVEMVEAYYLGGFSRVFAGEKEEKRACEFGHERGMHSAWCTANNGEGSLNARRGCNYKTFMASNPKEFYETEGAVGLMCWFENVELKLNITKCADADKVKYAACLLQGRALTLWNTQDEVQKLESKFWNHQMLGTKVDKYTARFHELAKMLPHMVRKNKEGNGNNGRRPPFYECESLYHLWNIYRKLNRAPNNDNNNSGNLRASARDRVHVNGTEEAV